MTNEIKEAITEALELVYLKQLIKDELFKAVNELEAKNDRWITLKPHGKEADDYKRLLIKDGEDIEDAMHRQGYYKKRQAKTEKTLQELQKEKDNAYSEAIKAKKAGDEKTFKEWTKKFWELTEKIKNFGKDNSQQKNNNTNTKNSFTEAISIKDAISETNKYAGNINKNISSMPLENINAVNSGLHYIYNNVCKYGKLKEIRKNKMKALAAADDTVMYIGSMANYSADDSKKEFDKEITNWQSKNQHIIDVLSKQPKLTKTQKNNLKKAQENIKFKRFGVYSKPENLIKETIIHELGHVISIQAMRKDQINAGKITFGFGSSQKEIFKVPIENTETANLIKQTLEKARNNGDIYKISQYGNKNKDEFFAETFLMYNIGEKLPDYIKEMIEKTIKKI